MKKSMLSTKQSYLMCAVGIVVLFGILMGVCESGMASTYIKGIMMTSCIAIIMTTSLNLTIGVLGQLTLGCCGFEAIGAYSAALLSKLLVANGVAMDPTLRFLLTTLAGGVVACIFGILVGIPALRLHGDYLAIITLGFGEIIRVIIQNLKVAGGMGLDIAFQGIIITLLVLASFFAGVYFDMGYIDIADMIAGTADAEGVTMAFITLSMVEIFHSFNMRSRRASIFTMKTQNKWLWGAAALALALTVVPVEVDVLANVFGFMPLPPHALLTALGLALLIIPIMEVYKAIMRGIEKNKA